MKHWTEEVIGLLNGWQKVAGQTTILHLSNDREKTADEVLVGYAVARHLLDYVFVRFINQKSTLSEDEEELLGLSVEIAKLAIPRSNPLWDFFMTEVSHISGEYGIK